MRKILIVEDDITFLLMLKTWLAKHGFEVETAGNVEDGKRLLSQSGFSAVLTDMRLPDQDGIYLLQWIGENRPELPAIVMTSYADIQNAVLSMKLGARDYIAKPVNPEELLKKLNDLTAAGTSLEKEGVFPVKEKVPGGKKKAVPAEYIEGRSDAARKLYNHVRLVAPTNMPVLIKGASGTGKEHIARLIHQESRRKDRPFIAVDCGAIPKDLAGSEFFGHKKGSFTGALSDKKGAFAEADGGTLFLDEVGNLSYEVQVQLLRALQEKKIRPIGTNVEIEVDIRLVTATNENLENAIKKGTFREDLYHRLNGFSLEVPELKQQKEDIMLYADFFLDQANRELGKQVTGFDKEAVRILERYDWPGNLRQMKNMIMCAALLAPGEYITPAELPVEIKKDNPDKLTLYNQEAEKATILRALESSGNNKSKAAKMLGIDRKTLYNKMKLYHIGQDE